MLFGFLKEDEAIGEGEHDGAVVEGEDVSESVLLHLGEEGWGVVGDLAEEG